MKRIIVLLLSVIILSVVLSFPTLASTVTSTKSWYAKNVFNVTLAKMTLVSKGDYSTHKVDSCWARIDKTSLASSFKDTGVWIEQYPTYDTSNLSSTYVNWGFIETYFTIQISY